MVKPNVKKAIKNLKEIKEYAEGFPASSKMRWVDECITKTLKELGDGKEPAKKQPVKTAAVKPVKAVGKVVEKAGKAIENVGKELVDAGEE